MRRARARRILPLLPGLIHVHRVRVATWGESLDALFKYGPGIGASYNGGTDDTAVARTKSWTPTPELFILSCLVRRRAAKTLGEMQSAAREAVPALTKALEDQGTTVREWAADALKETNKTDVASR